MGTQTLNAIEAAMRELAAVEPIAAAFLPPPVAAIAGAATSAEPVIEKTLEVGASLLNSGADHTAVLGTLGTLFMAWGQKFMTMGVLSPPPAAVDPGGAPSASGA